jgi:hypothetical protein
LFGGLECSNHCAPRRKDVYLIRRKRT